MILSFKFEIEVPVKSSAFWEDIKKLETDIFETIAKTIRDSDLMTPQLRITGEMKHDAEEIKKRGKESRL